MLTHMSSRKFIYRAIVVVCVLLLTACFKPGPVSETEKRAKNVLTQADVTSAFVSTDDVKLHYMKRGTGSTLLVFVHGTPGSWTIFSPQLESEALLKHAQLIAIDRPGWGKSTRSKIVKGDVLTVQSQLIGPALKKLKSELKATSLILVGHSLGASLVPRIAMDFPELADAVVSIAGDLTDQYSATHWYNGVATWGLVRWMLPNEMQRANSEVLSIGPSLKAMKPLWKKLSVPFLVIQGQKDSLVDPKHANFAESLQTESSVRVERFKNGGHLVHVTDAGEVNRLIVELIRRKGSFFKE